MPLALLTAIFWQLHIFKIKTKSCNKQPLTNQQQTAVQYTALLCACYLLQTTALLERGLGACKASILTVNYIVQGHCALLKQHYK